MNIVERKIRWCYANAADAVAPKRVEFHILFKFAMCELCLAEIITCEERDNLLCLEDRFWHICKEGDDIS